jgi:hypothetical protein
LLVTLFWLQHLIHQLVLKLNRPLSFYILDPDPYWQVSDDAVQFGFLLYNLIKLLERKIHLGGLVLECKVENHTKEDKVAHIV